jgi:hypothetical protein
VLVFFSRAATGINVAISLKLLIVVTVLITIATVMVDEILVEVRMYLCYFF